MIYFLILIYFIICALLFDVNINRRTSGLIYFSQFVVLVLLFGLRYRVGGDSLTYQDEYFNYFDFKEIVKVNIFQQRYQPLWYVITAIPKTISKDFFVFQLFHAIVLNLGIFYLIDKYCEKRFLGILFYYIFYSIYFNTEILRESLAVVIFAFAYPLIFKRKYVLYFLLCFVAYFIHAFAMFCFIVPFLVWIFRKPISISTFFLILIIAVVVPQFFISLLLKYGSFNIFITRQLEHYTKLDINFNGIIKNIFDAVPVLILILINKANNRFNRMFIPALNIYLTLLLMGTTLSGAIRLGNYFVIFYYIVAANTFVEIARQKHLQKFAGLAAVVVFCFVGERFFYFGRDFSKYNYGKPAAFYNRYYPYHSIFDHQKDQTRENIVRGLIIDDSL